MQHIFTKLYIQLQQVMLVQEWIWLHSVGLGYTSMIHKVVENVGYIIALCERWDSSNNIFHLLMGECTMNLEDIW